MIEAMITERVVSDTQRAQACRAELAARLARSLPADGSAEPLPGLHIFRLSAPTKVTHTISDPAFCVIAQGCKEVLQGGSRYQYDPAHYLLTTVDLPIASKVIEASPAQPYLSLRLNLDLALVSAVMVEAGQAAPRTRADMRAINVSPLDGSLLDAALRLIRLLDTPAEAAFLAPLITREIIYRLLMGDQGARLRQIALQGGQTHRIAQAIDQLRKAYNEPLQIENLAHDLGMSVSGFHHHFKAVTALSPLQFQKRLRLQEARRLMLGEDLDATSAAYSVGYDDAAHFNREYKRLFGLPPMRDVERLRMDARIASALPAD